MVVESNGYVSYHCQYRRKVWGGTLLFDVYSICHNFPKVTVCRVVIIQWECLSGTTGTLPLCLSTNPEWDFTNVVYKRNNWWPNVFVFHDHRPQPPYTLYVPSGNLSRSSSKREDQSKRVKGTLHPVIVWSPGVLVVWWITPLRWSFCDLFLCPFGWKRVSRQEEGRPEWGWNEETKGLRDSQREEKFGTKELADFLCRLECCLPTILPLDLRTDVNVNASTDVSESTCRPPSRERVFLTSLKHGYRRSSNRGTILSILLQNSRNRIASLFRPKNHKKKKNWLLSKGTTSQF